MCARLWKWLLACKAAATSVNDMRCSPEATNPPLAYQIRYVQCRPVGRWGGDGWIEGVRGEELDEQDEEARVPTEAVSFQARRVE